MNARGDLDSLAIQTKWTILGIGVIGLDEKEIIDVTGGGLGSVVAVLVVVTVMNAGCWQS